MVRVLVAGGGTVVARAVVIALGPESGKELGIRYLCDLYLGVRTTAGGGVALARRAGGSRKVLGRHCSACFVDEKRFAVGVVVVAGERSRCVDENGDFIRPSCQPHVQGRVKIRDMVCIHFAFERLE